MKTILSLLSGEITQDLYKYNWKQVLLCMFTIMYPNDFKINQVFKIFIENFVLKAKHLNQIKNLGFLINKSNVNISIENLPSILNEKSLLNLEFLSTNLYSNLEELEFTNTSNTQRCVILQENLRIFTNIARINAFQSTIEDNNDNHVQFIIIHILRNILPGTYECIKAETISHLTRYYSRIE